MENNTKKLSKKKIYEYLRRTQPLKPRVARRPAFPRPFSVGQVRLHNEQQSGVRAKRILPKRVQARLDCELSELIPEHQSNTNKKIRPPESYYNLNYSSNTSATRSSNASLVSAAGLVGESEPTELSLSVRRKVGQQSNSVPIRTSIVTQSLSSQNRKSSTI